MSDRYKQDFAGIYNRNWNDFSDKVAPFLLAYFRKYNPSAESILDLCCGCGRLSAFFADNGYNVTGIDNSESMLYYARLNNTKHIADGRSDFILADARDFTMEDQYDFCVSTFDAMNHLETIEDLRQCFSSVYNVLTDDSVFIFDLNTARGLENCWFGVRKIKGDDFFLIQDSKYDCISKMGTAEITCFVETGDNVYRRSTENLFNKAFNLFEVSNILIETGFRYVSFARISSLDDPLTDPEEEYRVFIVAEKQDI